MYVHICFSKNIAIGITFFLVFSLPVVEAAATTEDITKNMSSHHDNMCLTWLVNGYYEFIRCVLGIRSTSNGSNLTTAVHAITNDTIPQGDVGNINITVGCITTTKGITSLKHDVVADSILVNLFHKVVINVG